MKKTVHVSLTAKAAEDLAAIAAAAAASGARLSHSDIIRLALRHYVKSVNLSHALA